MTEQRDILFLAKVTRKDAEVAYHFHERMAANPDSHLWARSEHQIKKLIKDGCVFGAWMGTDKKLVALCYVALSDNEENWEIGGMAVDDTVKRRKIGTVLLQFALAYMIVHEEPWNTKNNQRVIAHVHESNQDPRSMMEKLGFRAVGSVEVSECENPPKWMKRNTAGKIIGHQYEFPPASSKRLAAWFDEELDQYMKEVNVEFGFGYAFNLDDFKADLREISESFE